MSKLARQTHLEYYKEHQIAPVRYDLSSLDAHMERRFSLYAKIGLTPLAFSGSRVLEVAAGTGHNSLYVAQTMPAQLVLLEPNPAGVEHIREVYSQFSLPHTEPEYAFVKLEDFKPDTDFDIVLCENWLGTSQHELTLLDKLSNLVAEQGMLVVTTISPVGFLANLMRRFFSAYLSPLSDPFQKRTEVLVSAFGGHLNTLTDMTRSHIDWVQDNMMNPAYFSLCLSIPDVLERVGGRFDIIGTSPCLSEDWRWFKGMNGTGRRFNEHFLCEYWKKSHNFLDCRVSPQVGDADMNKRLEQAATNLLVSVRAHEDLLIEQPDGKTDINDILQKLDDVIACVSSQFSEIHQSLQEVREFVVQPNAITVENIANMAAFKGMFGRETAYISLVRVSK